MKKLIIVLSAVAGLLSLTACVRTEASKSPNILAGSLLVDITDSLASLPDSQAIVGQFAALRENHATGAIFYSATLSAVQYTPSMQDEIRPESFLTSNPGARALSIDTFLSRVGNAVKAYKGTPIGQSHSDLYVPIANEANRLMTIPASRRFLIVYSNLYENGFFSLYKTSDTAMLAQSPTQVESLFQQQATLHNLNGLHVSFIYQPTSYEDGVRFGQISSLYRRMFEKAGAIVTISATLQNP